MYGGSAKEQMRDAAKAACGDGYYLAGTSLSDDGDITENIAKRNWWIIQIAGDGTLVWQNLIGGSNTDYAYSITDDGVAVGGVYSDNGDVTDSLIGNADGWVMKLDVAPLAVNISASSNSICLYDSITLSASGAQTYLWQPGNFSATSIIVNPTENTTYSLLGTNENGCQGKDSISVAVFPLPAVDIGNDTMVCDNIVFILDAGAGFISYLWSTGETAQQIQVTATNNYWVEVQDSNGCIASDTINVILTSCLGSSLVSAASGIILFPNPASDRLALQLPGNFNSLSKIKIADALGRIIRNEEETSTGNLISIPLGNDFPDGIYLLMIQSQGKSFQKIFEVQH